MRRPTTMTPGLTGAACVLTFTCAAVPARAQPEERPERARDGGDRPLPGTPVALPELLEVAEAQAPALVRARAAVERGDAAIAGASKLLPYNPIARAEAAVSAGGVPRYEARLSQRLEIAGQRGLRIREARRSRDALAANADAAGWSVHQRIHRLFRVAVTAEARVLLEREALSFTEELHAIAEARHEAGEEPRTSVVLSRAELARARQALERARVTYESLLYELAAASGWTRPEPPRPRGELPEAREAPPAETLVRRAAERDPQLAALRARLAERRASVALEEREVWPDPTLGVGYEREELPANLGVENVLLVEIGVPIPLWDRDQGEIARARADRMVVAHRLQTRRRVLDVRVRQAAAEVDGAAAQAAIYEAEVLPALEEQLALLREGFELGEMSLIDVINARDRLVAVQRRALAVFERYVRALSDLEQTLGAPVWSPEQKGNDR